MSSLLWAGTDAEPRWKKWKKFSGPMVRGLEPLPVPPAFGVSLEEHGTGDHVIYHGPHWDRVSYLTAMVESGGKFGTCVMFDGTGITAGLHQAVAVYPRNLWEQGPLWKLLWRMNSVIPLPYYPLWGYIEESGWQLSPRGLIWQSTWKDNVVLVPGRAIRPAVAPVDGVVPNSGEHFDIAEKWLAAFHEVFSTSPGHRTQVLYGIEHFINWAEKFVLKRGDDVGELVTLEDVVYKGAAEDRDPFSECPELDLAMALFWCNWVNGPSVANRIMKKHYKKIASDPVTGAVRLVYDLGTAKYGRWDDDIGRGEGKKYKSRYQRFRTEAKKLYPKELFQPGAIMSDDLPG